MVSSTFLEADDKNPFRQWTAQELIDIAMATPMKFTPGTNWAYSHTNFVILGEALTKIGGKPLGVMLDEHIFKPLGLKETEFPATATIRHPVLHAFSSARGIYEDCTYWSPSWTSNSGLMTSNLHDLGVITRAIGSGSLLSKKSYEALTAPTTAGLGGSKPNLYYGLGIIMINGWLAQNPRFNGYTLFIAHLPAKKLSIVVANTNGPKTPPHVAYSTLIFKELARLLAPEAPIPEEIK